MKQTIQVQSVTLSGNKEWYNIKSVDDKDYSIGLKDKKTGADKNPGLKQAIEVAQAVPYPLTGDVADWQGKFFLNDAKPEGAGKPFIKQQNQELIVAQSSVKSACELNRELGVTTIEEVLKEAEKIYNWVMSKSKA